MASFVEGSIFIEAEEYSLKHVFSKIRKYASYAQKEIISKVHDLNSVSPQKKKIPCRTLEKMIMALYVGRHLHYSNKLLQINQ